MCGVPNFGGALIFLLCGDLNSGLDLIYLLCEVTLILEVLERKGSVAQNCKESPLPGQG